MTAVEDEREKEDRILLQPLRYITDIPGKQIRTKLAEAFNVWLNIDQDKLKIIADVIQMLHNASLLIDDIEDNSSLRRGIPVAHSIYGVPSVINSANYAYFLGLQKALTLEHPKVTEVFTEQLLELHRGQGMEIHWRDSFTCPNEEEYKQMVIRKTGGLFGLAVRMMQLFSVNQSDFTVLTGLLGLYFQIRDDYANLCLQDYIENKSYGEDLTEGKFSYPVIHAIRNFPEDSRIMNILKQRTHNIELKKYCVVLLEKFGSLEYTRKTLEELEIRIIEEINRLDGNLHLMKVLDELSSWKQH